MEVRKYGSRILISRDEAVWHGLVEPTAAEQAEMDRSRADYERRKQAATEAWPAFAAALEAVTDPVARALLDLHKSVDARCDGCELGSYAEDRPEWPCITTTTIAEVLGIPIPPDLDLAEQARA